MEVLDDEGICFFFKGSDEKYCVCFCDVDFYVVFEGFVECEFFCGLYVFFGDFFIVDNNCYFVVFVYFDEFVCYCFDKVDVWIFGNENRVVYIEDYFYDDFFFVNWRVFIIFF